MTVMCSADCHLMEPPDLWVERLPKAMRHLAPRYEYTDTHRIWHWEGKPHIKEPLAIEAREDGTPITDDVDLRLKELDQDGIWAEMIFGNMGALVLGIADPALAMASAKVFNDYLAEAYVPHGHRELPVAMVPVHDIGAAVAEIERVAALGLRSVGLPQMPPRPYLLEEYDAIWASAQSLGLPLSFHVGTGASPFGASNPLAAAAMSERAGDVIATSLGVLLTMAAQNLVASFVGSGTLARFPELKVLVVESGAGWLAPLMESMDFAWVPKVGHNRETELPINYNEAGEEVARSFGFKQGGWKHSLKPSELVRRQVKVTFMDEPAPLKFLHVTGTEPLLWGSDFPHPEGTWPRSRAVVDELFADVSATDRHAITNGNFAKLFDLTVPDHIAA
jgi:predicted TIM-barrel fold metal-dependent hydrolase